MSDSINELMLDDISLIESRYGKELDNLSDQEKLEIINELAQQEEQARRDYFSKF
jgi:hypothetical protein